MDYKDVTPQVNEIFWYWRDQADIAESQGNRHRLEYCNDKWARLLHIWDIGYMSVSERIIKARVR